METTLKNKIDLYSPVFIPIKAGKEPIYRIKVGDSFDYFNHLMNLVNDYLSHYRSVERIQVDVDHQAINLNLIPNFAGRICKIKELILVYNEILDRKLIPDEIMKTKYKTIIRISNEIIQKL